MRSANGPVKIKICGLRTLSDVQAVNGQLPEYTGFIFDPLRKRYISPEQAEELRRRLDARIRPVGVFVNAGTEEIRRVLEICRLDMVQLHGQETDEEIRRLREEYKGRSELCIVKAFRIENEEDVRKAEKTENFRLDGCLDTFSIDAVVSGRAGYECTIHREASYE